jgi:hypothetical protein
VRTKASDGCEALAAAADVGPGGGGEQAVSLGDELGWWARATDTWVLEVLNLIQNSKIDSKVDLVLNGHSQA